MDVLETPVIGFSEDAGFLSSVSGRTVEIGADDGGLRLRWR